VLVPDVDDLAVADEGGESLAQTVDELSNVERESFVHESRTVVASDARQALAAAGGEDVASGDELALPTVTAPDAHAQPPAGESGRLGSHVHLRVHGGVGEQGEPRKPLTSTGVARHLDADDVGHRREVPH